VRKVEQKWDLSFYDSEVADLQIGRG